MMAPSPLSPIPGLRRVAGALMLIAVCFGRNARADESSAFANEIRPLIETYCTGCHNAEKSSGDLDLMRFRTTDNVLESLAIWRRMGMRIQNKEMPPKRSQQPSQAERDKITAWIATLKDVNTDCNKIATEENSSWYRGYVMSRRLNRAEYENTVRDLLGIEIKLASLFPADGSGGEGFDNHGDALFLSSIQIEKYLEAADLAIESVLPERKRGPLAGMARFFTRAFKWRRSPEERKLSEARQRLIIAKPGFRLKPRDAARKTLDAFASRAWRRPASKEETDRLLEAFDRSRARGDVYETSLKLAFKAALVSPHFLFLAEPEPESPGVHPLGDFPLASRLSYFLWSSMPDEELYSLAREGDLRDTETLRLQVRRMLEDPKSRALGENFATQWLGLRQLGGSSAPDAARFPEFDDALADSMRQESVLYFSRIVQEDRSLLELIDSDYTFANERLAKLYALTGITGDEMRKVQLADANRGGVLGMAGVLTATSHPLRTSPVLRGKWVLEQVLGDRVPPPPPDAGRLPEDDVQPDGLTLRARLEAHRTRPECASCHARMDPIGFGLENFDPIGRWRTEQAGQPIDASGLLPSGEAFRGPRELKAIVMKRKDDFARNLSRKMLGYALGRSLTSYEDCVVEGSVKRLRENGYRAPLLFEEIVLSYPFRHRYSARKSSSE